MGFIGRDPVRPRLIPAVSAIPVLMTPILTAAIVLAALLSVAKAQQPAERTFLGREITGGRAHYIVTRDVNVRAEPETASRRVTGLKAGQEVVSPGRYQGWVAIEKDNGEPLGFAYFKYMQPFIDGGLASPIAGSVAAGPGVCDYTIEFAGKTQPEGEAFSFADYNVAVTCQVGDKTLAFDLFAFMSEGPYARGKDTVHQIGIDLLAITEDYDNVLSTIILYDHDKLEITFDQITLEEYARKPEQTVAAAENVSVAIEKAVRMALMAWNAKVWEDLAKALG